MFGLSVGCSPIHVQYNVPTAILLLLIQIRQLPFKVGSENIVPKHWGLLGIIVVSILSHLFSIPEPMKKDFSLYTACFTTLLQGTYEAQIISVSVPPYY